MNVQVSTIDYSVRNLDFVVNSYLQVHRFLEKEATNISRPEIPLKPNGEAYFFNQEKVVVENYYGFWDSCFGEPHHLIRIAGIYDSIDLIIFRLSLLVGPKFVEAKIFCNDKIIEIPEQDAALLFPISDILQMNKKEKNI